MKTAYAAIVCLAILPIANALGNDDDKESLVVDTARIKEEGLVAVAQRAADFKGSIALSTATQPTSAAATGPNAGAVLDEVSKHIGSEISQLGHKCAPMPEPQFRKTLTGLIRIINSLEAHDQWRSTLCGVELRSKCLAIIAARCAGLGEEMPEGAACLLKSRFDAASSKKYQALLASTFPAWKQEVQSLAVPFASRDWYALYNLARTGDKKAWPDRNPIVAAIFSSYEDQSFRSNAPNMQDLAFAVLINEFERLRVTWLLRMKRDMGVFPRGRDEYLASAKHMKLTKEDVLPISDEPIEAITLWKFYRIPLDRYEEWTKEKKP
jgi:hypothetical protein